MKGLWSAALAAIAIVGAMPAGASPVYEQLYESLQIELSSATPNPTRVNELISNLKAIDPHRSQELDRLVSMENSQQARALATSLQQQAQANPPVITSISRAEPPPQPVAAPRQQPESVSRRSPVSVSVPPPADDYYSDRWHRRNYIRVVRSPFISDFGVPIKTCNHRSRECRLLYPHSPYQHHTYSDRYRHNRRRVIHHYDYPERYYRHRYNPSPPYIQRGNVRINLGTHHRSVRSSTYRTSSPYQRQGGFSIGVTIR